MRVTGYSDKHLIAAQDRIKEKDYWTKKMSGNLTKSSFPYDFKRKQNLSAANTASMELDGDIFSGLMNLSNNFDITLHMILAAGVIILLEKYTGNKDIIVGVPIYSQDVETEFINTTLPLRNQLNENTTFRELLRQVRETIVEANENQNYPMTILLGQLGMPLTENSNSLFGIFILLENIQNKKYIQHISSDMTFLFLRTGESIKGMVEYKSSLYKKDTIELIINHFKQLLLNTLFNVNIEIGDISLLSREEKNRILYDFNKMDKPYPNDKKLNELFEKQVEKTPDSTAIVHKNRHLTFNGLNKRSNQLARLLREKGIKSDRLVGLIFERSIEMIVGILGILKTGAAFLPIDPHLPKNRILLMLDECQVSILLTRKNTIKKHFLTTLLALDKMKEAPYVTAKRRQITDFDKIPIPNRSMVDYELYNRNIGQAIFKHCISLQATRGCPYQCLYCHKIWPKKHVFRSAENIFEEVALYYKMGVRRFALIDDIFNLNKENSSRFFQLIIKNKLDIQLAFPNGVRGDILTKDYIDLMVEAGTIILAFALETASPRLQKLIGKHLNLEKFRENIEYFCEKYPHVILELFTMHGFPSETKDEAMMTLDFIKNLKWLHLPYVFILKIYPNTDMARFALEHGTSIEQINKSIDLLYNELPETLPFEKSFTLKYQSDFFNNYFLLKERLLHVLPYQMEILSEDEMIQLYNGYLPGGISSFSQLIESFGITSDELSPEGCKDDSILYIPGLQKKMKNYFPLQESDSYALKVLLLDLSHYFSNYRDIFSDNIEAPLGLMYLMTYLKKQFASKINGKVAKSRIDFDNYEELKRLLDTFKPDVIGIRTLTSLKDFFHMTVTMIRQWGIDVPIIAGGPYATSSFQTILQDRNIDLVVLGEGEVTFSQLIGYIIENDGTLPDEEILKKIAGIAFIPEGPRIESGSREIVILDELTGVMSKKTAANLKPVHSPQSLAYTIFTSGSTGKPKGVPITHSNLSPLLHWGYKHLDLNPGERVIQNLSYFFDWSVWEIFITLTSGASLHIAPVEVLLDPEAYIDFLNTNDITVLHITPTQLQTLIELEQKMDTLKYLCIGAEKLTGDLLKRSDGLVSRNCRIFNMYGPTEATIMASVLHIGTLDRKNFEDLSSVPIGNPAANAELLVLDKNLEICPINMKGELYIAGDCLALGYLNDPAKTSKKFIKNVFNEIKGDVLYSTGDIVRWLPDGSLEFLRRKDSQVKIRGFRIELNEIESLLLSYGEIRDVIVTVIDADERNRYLCAYYVPMKTDLSEKSDDLNALDLKRYMSRELPDYMIPTYFVPIEKIPLTPNGKLDRNSLPPPEVPGMIKNYTAPGNEIEMKMGKIWSETLGIDKHSIGIDIGFFELGGNSLNAVTLISNIHKEFNVKLQMSEVFRKPTIRELSKLAKEAAKNRYASIEAVEKKDYYVLSSAQKRLYIIYRMVPRSTVYNMPEAVTLPGEPDIKKLEATFTRLIERHESLRTSFHMVENEPVQVIRDTAVFKIECFEVSHPQPAAHIRDRFVRPFDLSRGPLLRVGVVKTADNNNFLLVDMHHIISDGISHQVLIKDFTAFYEGEALTPLRIQYKDFSEWQNRDKEKENIKQQETYWLKEFNGDLPVPDIHTDYPRPTVRSFEGGMISFEISENHSNLLKAIALEEKATLFMVLLAVYNILLSRLTGLEDIIAGTPVAGRRHADLETVIGMFVNTLALRNYPKNGKTFREFLVDVRERTLEAFENQEYPFEDLVETLSPKRDTGRNPLFDYMFVFQNINEPPIENQPAKPQPEVPVAQEAGGEGNENRTAKFDITLIAVERNKKMGFLLEYCSRLFKKETIQRFIAYFNKIVSSIVKDANIKLSQIEILPGEEKNRLLYDFNNTRVEYPEGKTIHQLFKEQARRTPNAVALHMSPMSHTTYAQLNEKSDRLAGIFKENGLKPGGIAAVLVERSAAMITGMLAILKTGGAYLPIDPQYPDERIKFMLKDSRSLLLFTQKSLEEKGEGTGCEILDAGESGLYEGKNEKPVITAGQPGDLAYVIYTSGSTGKPKGVMIEHRGIPNITAFHKRRFSIDETDRVVQFAASSFDASVWEMYMALLNGAALYLPTEDIIAHHEKFEDYLLKNAITVATLPPAYANYLNADRLKSLRLLVTAGSAATPGLVDKWKDKLDYINAYGPTETTICAAAWFARENGKDSYLNGVPIGNPIDNTCIYILDNRLNLQPTGVPGELCIAGAGLGRGYLNNPNLTAAAFNKSYRSYILYKTGDLARWLPGGNIEFLGRIDHQVKIRGYRIELGEIENRLQGLDKINEAVVLERQGPHGSPAVDSGDSYLCAYIVSEEEVKFPWLSEMLAKSLPHYMLPSHFVKLAEMPLTSSGKVDRNALPEPDIRTGTEYRAPRNDIEVKLVEIWENLLAGDSIKIGIDDNFFKLGGHSLKATIMVSRIHKALDVQIPLVEIFKTPTIKGLARYISSAAINRYASIEPVEKMEYYPLSSAQKRLYILQQLELNSTVYNMPEAIPLPVGPDIRKLEDTFLKLINRHESLRTSFHMAEGEPVQRIHPDVDFEIEYFDAGREFVSPFDLSRAPLLRVGLVQAGDSPLLLVDMHHIISDGVSREILVKDFFTLYQGEALPPLRVQYKDFSQWQNSEKEKENLKRQEEYWLKEFEGEIPVLNMPTDYTRPAVQSFEGSTLNFEMGIEETNSVKKLALEQGVTLYMVLLAIYNIFLAKISSQEDIVIGTPAAGRRHTDLEKIMGMFVNTMALRNYPNGDYPFKRFLKSVKERTLEAFENQDYQFEDLVEKAAVHRDAGRNPLFDVLFVLQNITDAPPPGEREGDTQLQAAFENRTTKFDLTLNGVESREGLLFSLRYSTKLFKTGTIERYITYLNQILNSVLDDPGTKISQIEILSAEEKRKLLYEFNDTEVEYPGDKTIHQLFEEQARRMPNAIALHMSHMSHITYNQLNRKSNQLAFLLREKGMKPDTAAAIMVERSIEMVVGMLAILKAGGAYLPIDPQYPENRINYMLEDSNANVLLKKSGTNFKPVTATVLDFENLDFELVSNFECRASGLSSASLAYVIYTSGSTGKSKGVLVEHRNAVNIVSWFGRKYVQMGTHVLMMSEYTFDPSVNQVFGSLHRGAVLYIVDKELLVNIQWLRRYIERHQIHILNFVPSVFNDLLGYGKKLESVQVVLSGGERLDDTVKDRITERGYALYNQYGPTETTIDALVGKCSTTEKVTLGTPVFNAQCYIFDKYDNLTPPGVAGELCIGGAGVTRGYLNNPELTNSKFQMGWHPLSFSASQLLSFSLYRTGDLARWLPNGNVEFLGRIDSQLKIRGFRVEPGEIENRLSKHGNVKECVVLARKSEAEGTAGEKSLCAYIVPEQEITLSDSDLREYLAVELPAYMIPAHFIQLEKVPLTPNGKIDTRALAVPGTGKGAEYAAPRNPLEERLVNIWARVLGRENKKIGINNNFFQLGGQSLKAVIMIAAVHKETNVKLPLAEIFKKPTIKGLAEYILTAAQDKYAPIEPVEKKEYYLLSPAQKRLFVLQQMMKDSIAYNMPTFVELEEKPDIGRLEKCFRQLINRHESLRTSFHTVAEKPVQVVRSTGDIEFKLQCYDFEDSIISRFVCPFDLSHAPLLRAAVIKSRSGKHILAVDMHHIISDGISQKVLEQDFAALYRGETPVPLRLQYKDYSQWQNSETEKETLKRQEKYWLKEFEEEIPVLDIPTDFPRPEVQSFEGSSLFFEIGRQETEFLNKTALQQGTTLYMVITAVTNIFLSKITGQEDIIIGTPTAGRRHADLEQIIGMFVNTLALRNYPQGEKPFCDFLNDVKERTLKAFENQEYPFEQLVEKVAVNRDAGRNPLFDIMFAFQKIDDAPAIPSASAPELHRYEARMSKFDMTMIGVEKRYNLFFTVQYCTKLFKEETIQRFALYFKKIVSTIMNDPGAQLSEIEIASEEEKKQVLFEFNDTQTGYPHDSTIRQLFAEQAALTPDNIAVVGTGLGAASVGPSTITVTYGELNEKASQLARRIRKKGIQPGHIAAIMPPQTIEMVIGILAVLKAGAAYLPIDVHYPEERITYMLKDSNSTVLLTDGAGRWQSKLAGVCETIDLGDMESYNGETGALELPNRSTDPAYIIYTSGSTGRPKGTVIEHHSLNNLCRWHNKRYSITAKDRASKYAGFGFDASVWEIFPYITIGASVYIVEEEIKADIHRLNRFFELNGITIAFLPTQFCEQFMSLSNNSLRILLTGGDKLRRFVKRDYLLVNNYGPTENTVVSTSFTVEQGSPNIPIGKPVDNTKLSVLDKYRHLQPIGVAGELCIAGVGLARGYLNNPQLTADKFNRSYKSYRTYIFYKTGDLARWLPNGNLEFLGRIDHQVKIRGYRIELGEIENRLFKHQDVKEALVLCKGVAAVPFSSDKQLCAYIVFNRAVGDRMSTSISVELKKHLSHSLPGYMIPAHFIGLEEFPLTANGKIDIKALPEPGPQASDQDTHVAPRDGIEEKILEIWRNVLGSSHPSIGVEDDFFQLGGHSLKATLMLLKIYDVFSVRVPLVEVFKKATIRHLAEFIKEENVEIAGEKDDMLVLLNQRKVENNKHLFLIHDGTGEVDGYSEFCHHLNSEFNCWGIRVGKVKNYAVRNLSIETLAGEYIRKIKKVRDRGPSFIVGWSLGGTIAFEMAVQLEQSGEQPGFLALIDSIPPQKATDSSIKGKVFTIESELKWLLDYLADEEIAQTLENTTGLEQLWQQVVDYLVSRNLDPETIKKRIPGGMAQAIPNCDSLGVKELIYYLNTIRTLHNARENYFPRGKSKANAHFFGASRSKIKNAEQWRSYFEKPLTYHTVTGDHFSVFKNPEVMELTEIFLSTLHRV